MTCVRWLSQGIVHPSPKWNEALAEQISLARRSAIQMALNYQSAGYAVTIDDFLDHHQLREYQALEAKRQIRKIVLYPKQDVTHLRNHERAGDNYKERDYIDEGIRFVYDQFNAVLPQLRQDGWFVLDTSELTVGATVAKILQV